MYRRLREQALLPQVLLKQIRWVYDQESQAGY
ncbi:hypothetical protein CFII68_09543 [Pseudomonas sp. CFII68]|nr:hypothetical protein CFII68_09543 [Pseudomonas sp. CFII68]